MNLRRLAALAATCLSTGAALAQPYTLSGIVRDGTGNPIFGRAIVLAYDPVSFEIVQQGFTDAEKRYSLLLPAGTFQLYVREFGGIPGEFGPIALTQDMEWDVQTPEPSNRFFAGQHGFVPSAIFRDGLDASTLSIEVISEADIDSAFVFNEFGRLGSGPVRLAKFRIHDDGTRGDRVAGDGKFSADGFVSDSEEPDAFVLYVQAWSGGASHIVRLAAADLALVDPDVPRVRPQVLSRNVAIGDHFVNHVVGPYQGSNWDWTQSVRTFYRLFGDDYDFLYVFVGSDTRSQPLGAFHNVIRNDIQGIGDPFRYQIVADSLGSGERLKGVNVFRFAYADPPLNHETAHYWANYLSVLEQGEYAGAHWGYTDMYGVLGGYPSGTLGDLGGGVYSNPLFAAPFGYSTDEIHYSDLELYLMGLIPLSEVRPSFEVLANPVELDWPNVTGTLRTVTREEIVAAHGPRTPDVLQSQKEFRAAFLVVTSELMSEAEATLISRLARRFSGELDSDRRLSFSDATGGRANMRTDVAPPVADPADIRNPRLLILDRELPTLFSADLGGLEQPSALWTAEAGLRAPTRLAHDEQGGDLYFVEDDGSVMTVPLAGGTPQATGWTAPGTGLAVDGPSRTLYYIDTQFRIVRLDLDSGATDVLTEPSALVFDVAVDPVGARIAWTDWRRLMSANLDGTAQEEVAPRDAIWQVAFARQTGTIFWSTSRYETLRSEIYRLDPSGPTRIDTMSANYPSELAVSPDGDRVFWITPYVAHEVRTPGNQLRFQGPWKTLAGLVFVPVPGEAPAVEGLSSAISNGTVDFTWSGVDQARYRIQIGVEGDPAAWADVGGLTEPTWNWTIPGNGPSGPIMWRVLAATSTGIGAWSEFRAVGTGVATDAVDLPGELAFEPVYPNPFKAGATLRFALPESSPVRLIVYDALGRRVAVLADELLPAGWHAFELDPSRLASGLYHAVLETTGRRLAQPLARIR